MASATADSGKMTVVNSSSVGTVLAGTVWKTSGSTHLDADYPAPSRNGLRQGVFLGPAMMREKIDNNSAGSRDLVSIPQVKNLTPNLIF